MNLTLTALLAGPLAALAFATSPDNIFVKGQDPITGVQITAENAVAVEYVKGGRKGKVDAHMVSGVVYEKSSKVYRRGLELFSVEDYPNAIVQLTLAADEPNAETLWVKEYAPYFLGRAYMATAQFDKAAEAFKRTLAAKRDSRLLGPVVIGLAQALMAQRQFPAANDALAGLKKSLIEFKAPGHWAAEADLTMGESLIFEGQFDKAANHLQDLAVRVQPKDIAADPEAAEIFVRAKRLQAGALIEAKDLTRARAVFSELMSRGAGGDMVAQAAARNGLAELDILDGKSLEQALYLLAQANVENFSAVSELSRTCYLFGLAHEKLVGKLDGSKDLAKSYFAETIRRFPESREAALARAKLKQM